MHEAKNVQVKAPKSLLKGQVMCLRFANLGDCNFLRQKKILKDFSMKNLSDPGCGHFQPEGTNLVEGH